MSVDKSGGQNHDDKNEELDFDNLSEEQQQEIDEAEEYIKNFSDDDIDDPEKAAELREALKKTKTTIHQKNHFREKSNKLQEALDGKGGKPEVKKPVTKKPKDGDGKEEFKITRSEKTEFRIDNPELSKEVVEEIAEFAQAQSLSLEDAVKRPMVQALIKQKKQDEDLDGAIPGNKNGRTGSKGKEIDWATASPAEVAKKRQQILANRQQ